MSLRLYFDHHVNDAIEEGLRQRGIDVLRAIDDGFAERSDEAILARASDLGRIVFTQDRDFLELAAEWQRTGREFSGIVYAHQMRITIGQAIRELELTCQVLAAEEIRNRAVRLPL
jgi:predicted nuclease of predicted toxin-antitoxin system